MTNGTADDQAKKKSFVMASFEAICRKRLRSQGRFVRVLTIGLILLAALLLISMLRDQRPADNTQRESSQPSSYTIMKGILHDGINLVFKPSDLNKQAIILDKGSDSQDHDSIDDNGNQTQSKWEGALQERADPTSNLIILSTVDKAYVDMAINLYETSFKKFQINNFLFVCFDQDSQNILANLGIPTYHGNDDPDGGSVSIYGTKAFNRKTMLKLNITLSALMLGYTVVLVDLDIVFFKNPIPLMTCADCEVRSQWDNSEINSGFLIVYPSYPTIQMYENAIKISETQNINDQKALSRALGDLQKKKIIRFNKLDAYQYPNGEVFFERGKRMFYGDNPCDKCVVVHNNWIVGRAAKEYRFKEYLLWSVDRSGYYSNQKAKYIAYDNPRLTSITLEDELQALKTALRIAAVLNRTLILPTFRCQGCSYNACKNARGTCALNTHLEMTAFDRTFKYAYREHVFLDHPKVPDSVKKSHTGTYLIPTDKNANLNASKEIKEITPADTKEGLTVGELVTHFGSAKESVLRFHSLYGSFSALHSADTSFGALVKDGFKRCDYRQYCEMKQAAAQEKKKKT